jgi:hypothetical protein
MLPFKKFIEENNKDDIMTGLEELEMASTVIYVGEADPDYIGLTWTKTTIEDFLENIKDLEGEIEGEDPEDVAISVIYASAMKSEIIHASGAGDYGKNLFIAGTNKQALAKYASECINLTGLKSL